MPLSKQCADACNKDKDWMHGACTSDYAGDYGCGCICHINKRRTKNECEGNGIIEVGDRQS